MQGDEFGPVEIVVELCDAEVVGALVVGPVLPLPDPKLGHPRHESIDVVIELVEVMYPVEFGYPLLADRQNCALEGSRVRVRIDEAFEFFRDRLLRFIPRAQRGKILQKFRRLRGW